MKINLAALFILGVSALFCSNTASAKTVSLGFQIGDVVAAEISGAKQEIINSEEFSYFPQYKKPVYVTVTLKMFPQRSISALDYNLTIKNATASCIAAVNNMDTFVSSVSEMYPDEKTFVRMLFVFDGSKVALPAAGKTVAGTLIPRITNRGKVTFNITSVGSKGFSDCQKIPATGALK